MSRALHGVSHTLDAASRRADDGEFSGVVVIGFRPDWTFHISAAGSVMRAPGVGIAAAHILASDMESRLRSLASSHVDRRA